MLFRSREAIHGGVIERVIGREVRAEGGTWVEHWDTRLAPDSSLTLRVPRHSHARFARATVTVFPDGFYTGFFSRMLAGSLSDTSRALITEAHRRTVESAYRLFDSTVAVR